MDDRLEILLITTSVCIAVWLIGKFLGKWIILGLAIIGLIGFGLGAIASFFAMIASIIHFQILWAMGFLLLAGILGGMVQLIADGLSRLE